MKIRPLGMAVAATAAMVGCATPFSEAPHATNFPASKQPKVQAAAHWNAIATDAANQIAAKVPSGKSMYVVPPTTKSAFNTAFANQLTSSLVARNLKVLKAPGEGLAVEIDTQVVSFSANRPQYRHVGAPTALATGLWALRLGEASGGVALYSAIAGADAYSWFQAEFATGETPKTEIVVTISVSEGNQYVSRTSSVYYTADSDKALYEAAGAAYPMRTLRVTGGE